MTEKRFTMYQNTIYDNGNILSPFNCMKVMNTLHNENEQLKKELEENKELIQFKEQVFNLINKKLEENEKELNGVDTAMYYANKGTLNELKKELKE